MKLQKSSGARATAGAAAAARGGGGYRSSESQQDDPSSSFPGDFSEGDYVYGTADYDAVVAVVNVVQEDERQRLALEEANQVLQAVGGDAYLDGFNLLGVVANPRGLTPRSYHGGSTSSSAAAAAGHAPQQSSSWHNNNNNNNSTDSGAAGGGGGSTDASLSVFTETFHSIEMTVQQVTEQMELLNQVLEDWSRHMFADDDDGGGTGGASGTTGEESDLPESQLRELPTEFQTLDLQALQTYLEKSNRAAFLFQQRILLAQQQQQQQSHQQSPLNHHNTSNNLLTSSSGLDPDTLQEEDIPAAFFQEDFDLTDPATFCELLLVHHNANDKDASAAAAAAAKDLPVYEWFPLQPPDALSGCLDRVELALLQQVRTKSGAFFEESLRFAQLQSWIAELLQTVQSLQQTTVPHLESDLLQPMLQIPAADRQRKQLLSLWQVLQAAQDLISCKSNILSGYLQHSTGDTISSSSSTSPSALVVVPAQDDYLTAIEQIQRGRQLLAGGKNSHGNNNNSNNSKQRLSATADDDKSEELNATTTLAVVAATQPSVELSRLHAFRGISDQFYQYEQLVVSNLREELVELFLGWNTAHATSIYVSSSITNAATSVSPLNNNTNTSTATAGSHRSTHQQQQIQQRVREIVGALKICNALTKTKEVYGNRLQDVIRMTVRTVVSEFAMDNNNNDSNTATNPNRAFSQLSVTSGTTGMTLERFLDCLDMLFEQLTGLLTSAAGVDEFCVAESFWFDTTPTTANNNNNAMEDNNNTNKDGSKNSTVSLDQNSKHGSSGMLDETDGVQNNRNGRGVSRSLSDRSTASSATNTSLSMAGTERPMTPMASIVVAGAELSSKSISELLRLRKDAHSLVSLDEMKRIWDACMAFTTQIENLSGHKAVALRSTLLAQAKAFVERKHERHMSALAAALESERWTQCDVSAERQAALTRLCSGRTVAGLLHRRTSDDFASAAAAAAGTVGEKFPDAEVEGTHYKVVWSCLLLIEMIMTDLAAAAHFSSLASNIVGKVTELLRLFNSRSTQLVLGAGAIHSAARLKSINAKHLSLVTQCLGIVIAVLPHVRRALMAQMPAKQHTLLTAIDQIKKEYADHNEKVLNKFVTIIGGIVEHGLAPKIAGTDFDARAQLPENQDGTVSCCVFLEGVSTNTRKMHQVLCALLPPDHLQDVFSRIFAFVDLKVPSLFVAADEESSGMDSSSNRDSSTGPRFSFPQTAQGKKRMLLEVEMMMRSLNGLDGVQPWDFTAITILERRLEYSLTETTTTTIAAEEEPPADSGMSAEHEKSPVEPDSEAETEVTAESGITMDAGDGDEAAVSSSLSSPNGSPSAIDDSRPLDSSSSDDQQQQQQQYHHAAEAINGDMDANDSAPGEQRGTEGEDSTTAAAASPDESRLLSDETSLQPNEEFSPVLHHNNDGNTVEYPSEVTTL